MPRSISTIPAFTAALLAALKKRPNLAKVQITDGPPKPGVAISKEWIMLGDVEGEQSVRALNRTTQPRHEEYVLHVMISVVRDAGSSQTAANERCFALAGEIEDTIRDEPSLEVAHVVAAIVKGPLDHTKRVSEREREAALEMGVAVTARI